MAEPIWYKNYDPGVPRSVAPYPDRTLLDYLGDAAREDPSAIALWFKGRTVTWAQLETESDACAAAFEAAGIRKGDRIALLLPNCPQFLIAEYGAWKLGAVACPLNPIYTAEELHANLLTVAPRIIVTLNPFYERVCEARPGTSIEKGIATNIKEFFPTHLKVLFTLLMERKLGHRAVVRSGDAAWGEFLAPHRGRKASAARPSPQDDALILLSGGTTGTPKGVPAWHHSLVMTAMQFRAWTSSVIRDKTDSFLLPLPLFHSYGACFAQSAYLVGRNPLALVPNPRDLDDLVKSVHRFKPRLFAGVPTLYNAILNHPDIKSGKASFRSLKICSSGAAPLMAETKRRFEEITGARIIEAYGLTESLLAATGNPIEGKTKLGSVGVPLPDVFVRIVDVDNPTRDLALREVGEILIRGPQMMRGYFNNPDETAAMLVRHADGHTWLHTADLGYMDEDGFVFIVDRKKDLIKAGGMQVWPRELEEALAKHPAVLEAGVRGFTDAAKGEIAVAFVVLRQGMQATEADLREFCKQHLAFFKVPARVVFRRELAKSMIGKVLRRELKLEPAEQRS
ncbi:MAG: long-chain fatty acid--CoA ligase [Gemmatimonadetes bacterium]|nr:long-chain fatty acid--CoA ligase [Gemmatimonadota bacterium]